MGFLEQLRRQRAEEAARANAKYLQERERAEQEETQKRQQREEILAFYNRAWDYYQQSPLPDLIADFCSLSHWHLPYDEDFYPHSGPKTSSNIIYRYADGKKPMLTHQKLRTKGAPPDVHYVELNLIAAKGGGKWNHFRVTVDGNGTIGFDADSSGSSTLVLQKWHNNPDTLEDALEKAYRHPKTSRFTIEFSHGNPPERSGP